MIEDLKKLNELYQAGVLTEEEFTEQKQRFLSANSPQPASPAPAESPASPAPGAHSSVAQPVEVEMGFGEAINVCFSKFTTLQGRARRAEYWWFYLFSMIANYALQFIIGLIFVGAATAGSEGAAIGAMAGGGLFALLVSLFIGIPVWSAGVRRLHDTGRSGWWFLIGLTFIGVIPLLIWLASDSEAGPNQYGPNPKFG